MPKQVIQAIRVHQYGGPEQLKLEQIPCPEPQAGEVLIRVHSVGVLPAEWKLRQGFFHAVRPAIFPYIPGSAMAGVIEKVGPPVTTFQIGQAVFGRSTNGAYAEYITTAVEPPALGPETFSLTCEKPETLSFDEAATISGGATIAWTALFEDGALQAGQRVLIHGAAGGVGAFAVQFARWKGAQVIGTTSQANRDFVQALGAATVIDYTSSPKSARLRQSRSMLGFTNRIPKMDSHRSLTILTWTHTAKQHAQTELLVQRDLFLRSLLVGISELSASAVH